MYENQKLKNIVVTMYGLTVLRVLRMFLSKSHESFYEKVCDLLFLCYKVILSLTTWFLKELKHVVPCFTWLTLKILFKVSILTFLLKLRNFKVRICLSNLNQSCRSWNYKQFRLKNHSKMFLYDKVMTATVKDVRNMNQF